MSDLFLFLTGWALASVSAGAFVAAIGTGLKRERRKIVFNHDGAVAERGQ